MKIKLELNILDDAQQFLNFWENYHGNDVVCRIINGKLFYEGQEITLERFIELILENMPDEV